MKTVKLLIAFAALLVCSIAAAGQAETFLLTLESLQNGGAVELGKLEWRYQAGDDPNWARADFDDAAWQRTKGTNVNPLSPPAGVWNGRAWFRLRLKIEDAAANRQLALAAVQKGASEIYIDGEKLIGFGEIDGDKIVEANPNRLPIPFRFERAGEHLIAVRFASTTFADPHDGTTGWLAGGKIYPGLSIVVRDAPDTYALISQYANFSSMRIGFFFVGFLLALALLHFLLYVFYRVERANLFYSIYAFALAVFLFCNNLNFFGHLPVVTAVITSTISNVSFAFVFLGLLTFIHVAFGRPFGKLFWALALLWAASVVSRIAFLNNTGYLGNLTSLAIGLSFTFSIYLLVDALRRKRPGAWILMVGVQLLAFGMLLTFVNEFGWLDLPSDFFVLGEIAIVLAVPVAVSIFLARNFARTNRDLSVQLAQVETLSAQKIEQEKQAAELRAENERRAKELEEARQLQLSMLPKKLPALPNLEIAAYMKPATEVGGDYYDFHVGEDGTLTVAVGDATGHGLKAGSVVTATKSLFNAFAAEENIPRIFKQSSLALKKMNLRGLFMAMAMLKIKDGVMNLSIAGMPSALIYRAGSGDIEKVAIRAVPLGSIANFDYQERKINLAVGDVVLLMSDGFPEMFNGAGEMLGFEKAAQILPDIAARAPQEIINRFVEISESWANGRPADDDVTFVVLKINGENLN